LVTINRSVAMMDSLKQELFTLCIQNGIDPETLDIENPDSDPAIAASTPQEHNFYAIRRIKQVCEGYVLAKGKFDNLAE